MSSFSFLLKQTSATVTKSNLNVFQNGNKLQNGFVFFAKSSFISIPEYLSVPIQTTEKAVEI